MFFEAVFVVLAALEVRDGVASIVDKEYGLMPPVFRLDDFNNCIKFVEKPLYCFVTLQLHPVERENVTEVWRVIEKTLEKPRYYRHDRLRYGVCVNTSCRQDIETVFQRGATLTDAISSCFTRKYEKDLGLRANVTQIHCETDTRFYPIDTYDRSVGFLIVTYLIFVFCSSVFEVNARYKSEENYTKFMSTKLGNYVAMFSVPRNWQKLRKLNDSPDFKSLRSIQGIRFYNMVYIIVVHSALLTFSGPVSNTQYVENMNDAFFNKFVGCSFNFAVQTFLLISGWLLCYNFMLVFEGCKTVKIKYLALAFVNRYFRLTPSLAVVIALHGTWLVQASRGPNWDTVMGKEYRNCRTNWWTNLLYINNYYDPKNMCAPKTWYLATDMQLYLMSLFVIFFLWKYPTKHRHIFASVIAAGIVTPGIINYDKNYGPFIRQYPETMISTVLAVPGFHIMYSSAYSNIGSYAIGMTFGYAFYKFRGENHFKSRMFIFGWWVFFFGLPLASILVASEFFKDGQSHNRVASAVYSSLGRNVYALGIGIGIFGMTQRVGWFVRWLTEWQAVQIFGQLSFCAYLIHGGLEKIRAASIRSPAYISMYSVLVNAIGDVVISYAAALVLCLFVEMPFSSLQKYLIPQMVDMRKKGLSEKSQERLAAASAKV